MRALFLVPYPVGRSPGQRFRFEQWLDLLPPGSVHAEVCPLFSEAAYGRLYEPGGAPRKTAQTLAALARRLTDLWQLRRADVVFVYRELFPLGPPLLEHLVDRRAPLVFDFDDAIWLADTSPANRIAGRLKSRSKVGLTIEMAATTTAGNSYLAEYARQFSDAVTVIPTTLDIERYRPRERPNGTRGRLVVGWSGSPTTSPHLRSIAPALRRIVRDLPVELVVLGDPNFTLAGVDGIRSIPWQRDAEIPIVSSFDIGLMPLPDDEWSRGKCGFKALLYMSLGVPAMVSPVGVNTEIVTHGENGLLAQSEDEWVEAIGSLVESESLRRRLGAAGRETVVERYSGQRWAPRFLEILESAASSR